MLLPSHKTLFTQISRASAEIALLVELTMVLNLPSCKNEGPWVAMGIWLPAQQPKGKHRDIQGTVSLRMGSL